MTHRLMSPLLGEPVQVNLMQRRDDVGNLQRGKEIRANSPEPQHLRSLDATGFWPVETDIYILPDGRVVVADLPDELADALVRLGKVEPCEIADYDCTDPIA